MTIKNWNLKTMEVRDHLEKTGESLMSRKGIVTIFIVLCIFCFSSCAQNSSNDGVSNNDDVSKSTELNFFIENIQSADFKFNSENGIKQFEEWLAVNETYVSTHLPDDSNINTIEKIKKRINDLSELEEYLTQEMHENDEFGSFNYFTGHLLKQYFLGSGFSFSTQQRECITQLANMTKRQWLTFLSVNRKKDITLNELCKEIKLND
jgi:hypothetical protein